MQNFLQQAVHYVLQTCNNELIQEALRNAPRVGSLRYATYAEYGHSPLNDLSNVIDSTATVVDDNVKALPAPCEVK